MPGTVYLGCGSAREEIDLWRLMLHRPLTRIVYWPFALPSGMLTGAHDWLTDALNHLGAPFTLSTWVSLDDHAPEDLDPADLLFVGGGNTFHLLSHVARAGFLEPVRRFVADGGDYYGGSAGAVLACDDIGIAEGLDPNDEPLTDLTGLGLLPGVSILPHFTESQLPTAQDRARSLGSTVIGLPETAGLCEHEGTFTVVGAGTVLVIDSTGVRAHSPGQQFASNGC